MLLVPHNRRRAAERLLMDARLRATWGPAPSAEAINAQDDARILVQALEKTGGEEAGEGDLVLARKLLEDRAPEAVAAALIQALRAPLAPPEELAAVTDRGPSAGPRVPREGGPQQEGVWFRMNLGRANGNADPRWVLPFLCRRGHVTRQEIGRIKVQDTETQFEVAPWAAERFAVAARKPGDEEDAHIQIQPLQGGAMPASTGPVRRPPPRGPRPAMDQIRRREVR